MENLELLTTEQILGDAATFIQFIRRTSYNARVITWGSGVGASLAAWARKKYPHLVDAAWSSSGRFDLEVASFSKFIKES